ncbi:MAG: hypothetical protein ABFS56_24665 [Pseudomonadota bacterium]
MSKVTIERRKLRYFVSLIILALLSPLAQAATDGAAVTAPMAYTPDD